MTEPLDEIPISPPKEDPEALVLRGRPRPAVRFRRGLIVGTTGAVAAGLVTLSWLALEPPSFRKAATAVGSDEGASKSGADALANVPSSYGDVPRLGPPLPGDLGRPILEHQRSLAEPVEGQSFAAEAEQARAAAEAERQRLAAAKQAARSSPVLVQLAGSGTASQPRGPEPTQAPTTGEQAPSASTAPAAQQNKIDFARPIGEGDLNPYELTAAASPWTLSAGTVIPASLITGLDSDLPGTVLAQVTDNVRDSATGRTILIPQGARLIGSYDSVVAYGQRRAMVVWTRIVLPDGSSLRLDNMPAADARGYAGVADRVDGHGWQLIKGVLLSSLLGVGSQLSFGNERGLVRALRESVQQNGSQAGERIVAKGLTVQPTIRVRPGWPLRVLVSEDLILRPWRG